MPTWLGRQALCSAFRSLKLRPGCRIAGQGQLLGGYSGARSEELRTADGWLPLACALGVFSATAFVARDASPAQCYYQTRPDGSVERLSGWKKLWGRTDGANPVFHNSLPHKALVQNLVRFRGGPAKAEGVRVLVPLCGKTADMYYLCEHGFDVIGIEGVTQPIMEFQAEQRRRPLSGFKGLKGPERWSEGPDGWHAEVGFQAAESFQGERPGWVFKNGKQGLGYYSDVPQVWRGQFNLDGVKRTVDIVQGDFFELQPGFLERACHLEGAQGQVDCIYDRAALVALPPEMRSTYVKHLSCLLQPGGRILLVTVDYKPDSAAAADARAKKSAASQLRHSRCSEADVRRLFPSGSWRVEVVGSQTAGYLLEDPALQDKEPVEKVFLITKKSGTELIPWGKVLLGSMALSALAAYCSVFGIRKVKTD